VTRDHHILLSLRADTLGFATLALAHALDSLVRVTRRVGECRPYQHYKLLFLAYQ